MPTTIEIFHTNCLVKWNCYNCPVCFYIRNPELMKNSVCMRCDRTNAVWFCITCGHVGCSRNERGHALAHYRETKHDYVMDLEKFVVWDYNLQEYVHIKKDTENRVDSRNKHINGENSCSCPVCRHIETPKLLKKSMCMKCADDITNNLWICLCCSHVGCSRLRKGHALAHYQTTKHSYCMQLNNFSIWDYSEHRYLHRFLHDNIGRVDVTTEYANATQKDNIDKRMDRLENEWNDFQRLSEANDKMLEIEQRLLRLTYEKTALELKLQEHDAKLHDLIKQFYGKFETAAPVNYIASTSFDMNSNQTKNRKLSLIPIQSQTESAKDVNTACCHDEAKPFQMSYDLNEVSENVQHTGFISVIVITLFLYDFITLVLQIIPDHFRNII